MNKMIFFVIVTALLAISVAIGFFIKYFNDFTIKAESSSWGQFGDYIGGTLNPVFGFLGLIALLYTLHQNQKALKISKKELKSSRKELAKSAKALNDQNVSLKKQTFENTFFQMLTLFNNIAHSLEITNDVNIIKGRNCFRVYYHDLAEALKEKEKKPYYKQLENKAKLLPAAYKIFWNKYSYDISNYFKVLFDIIQFIENEKVENDTYINLLKSQLSDHELLILFYHCVNDKGSYFLLYAETHTLFDRLQKMMVLSREHLLLLNQNVYEKMIEK